MAARDVTLPAEGTTPATLCYASLPEKPRAGVVVIHEIFGRAPEIDRVVDRFAAHGYAAVSPDLFRSAAFPVCVSRAMRAIRDGEGPQIEQIHAARKWLAANAGLDGKRIGVIGFCIGGGFALASASGFGAVSTNYGDVPQLPADLGPTIGCYGAKDRLFRGSAEKLRPLLEQRKIPHEINVFPGVGHSFLTDGDHPLAAFLTRPLMHVGYDPAVAEEAWGRILGFFDRHLAAIAIAAC